MKTFLAFMAIAFIVSLAFTNQNPSAQTVSKPSRYKLQIIPASSSAAKNNAVSKAAM